MSDKKDREIKVVNVRLVKEPSLYSADPIRFLKRIRQKIIDNGMLFGHDCLFDRGLGNVFVQLFFGEAPVPFYFFTIQEPLFQVISQCPSSNLLFSDFGKAFTCLRLYGC